VPAHGLRQLLYRMEHQQDLGVVGGVYCSKTNPAFPLVFRDNGAGTFWDWKIGEYFEVTGLGMDATLIRVELLEQLGPPWFKTVDVTQYLDAINHSEQWTEDLWFLNRVTEETDWKIYADGMVICTHWDPYNRIPFTLPKDSKPFQIQGHVKGTKKIVDLGCGESHLEDPEGKVIRVDGREDVKPDYRCDLRSLPFDNDEFDIVHSSHTLEHFGRDEVEEVLKEWIRILKPGGEFRVVVPNIAWAADQIRDHPEDLDWDTLNVIYGLQSYDLNFHKMAFTPETLEALLKQQGLEVVSNDTSGYNIIIVAKKKQPSAPEEKKGPFDQLAAKEKPK